MIESKLIECKKCKGNGYIDNPENQFEEIECEECNGDRFKEIPIGEDEIVYVNIYSVTREYGGPEEGGWWYNRLSCIESIPVKNKNSELMEEESEKEYEKLKYGNIYSVLGGRDIEVIIEEKPKQSETKERPHYE